LTQCVSNLLSNAVKFVENGKTPKVKIWTDSIGPEVRIWFRDNGIGIDRAHQSRIFQMFERAPHETPYDGTGIGLAIVHKAVERMGGKVGVESAPGEGSRFWIQLPKG
jgi:signal transduction histidine kinase